MTKSKAYRLGYDKGKDDAVEFYKFQSLPKKSFSLLFKMFFNVSYAKNYQVGYKAGFKEIVEARKIKKTLQSISDTEIILKALKRNCKTLVKDRLIN